MLTAPMAPKTALLSMRIMIVEACPGLELGINFCTTNWMSGDLASVDSQRSASSVFSASAMVSSFFSSSSGETRSGSGITLTCLAFLRFSPRRSAIPEGAVNKLLLAGSTGPLGAKPFMVTVDFKSGAPPSDFAGSAPAVVACCAPASRVTGASRSDELAPPVVAGFSALAETSLVSGPAPSTSLL